MTAKNLSHIFIKRHIRVSSILTCDNFYQDKEVAGYSVFDEKKIENSVEPEIVRQI